MSNVEMNKKQTDAKAPSKWKSRLWFVAQTVGGLVGLMVLGALMMRYMGDSTLRDLSANFSTHWVIWLLVRLCIYAVCAGLNYALWKRSKNDEDKAAFKRLARNGAIAVLLVEYINFSA